MQPLILRSCAYLFLLSCIVGVTSGTQHESNTIQDVLAEPSSGTVDAGAGSGSSNGEAQAGAPTIFNGIEVPPMQDLAGETFDAETKDGYWYAKTIYRSAPLLSLQLRESLEGCN